MCMSECAAHLFLQEHMQTGSLKNPIQNSLVFFSKSKTKRLQNKAVILTLQDVYGAAFRKPQLIICSTRLTSRTVSDYAWSGARQKLENNYCTGLPSKSWRTEIKPKAYIAANDSYIEIKYL